MSTLAASGDVVAFTRHAVAAMLDPAHHVKTATSAWARAELAQHDLVAADRTSAFAADDWQRCADRGILGVLVAAEYGGQGDDLVTALLTLEGLGHGCPDNGLTYAIASQVLSTQIAIERFGSEAQRLAWLPDLCSGSVFGAFAISERESGSDAYAMATTARRLPDGGYSLTGHKAHLTLGSLCDVVVVFASTDPSAGAWGLSAFVVPTACEGVELLGNRDKMGMRTTPFGDIAFHDVVLPADALLGREGAGASIFTSTLEAERSFVFATQIGSMERQLEDTIAYAKQRSQGGQPIGQYQAVAHRIADMKLRHETARMFMYKAALEVGTGRPGALTAAMTKLICSETAVASALDASRNHGAVGYVTEYEVERHLRDAIGGLVYSGTSDVQRNIIARLLGVG